MRKLGLFAVVVLGACGGDDGGHDTIDAPTTIDGPPVIVDAPGDSGLDPDANPLTPATLAGTGLCLDAGCTQINPDAHLYTPRFQLWSDGATKRRWIQLPPGTQIDTTTSMDYWSFPAGTKFWKEFTRDGVRVETRYMVKLEADDTTPGAWFFMTYQWNLAQNDTMAVTTGVTNANGTGHDIPSRSACHQCHDGLLRSHILGFGAIQLDWAGTDTPYDLDDLIAESKLTTAPAGAAGTAHFPLPGSANDQAALGYVHANCGHCHNPTAPTFGSTPVNFRMTVGSLATLADTGFYATTVNQMGALTYAENGTPYPTLIVPNDPDNSAVIRRMNSTNAGARMPQAGTEIVDPTGQTVLRQFITDLP